MRRWRHLPLRRPAPGGLAAAREPPRCHIVTVRTATMSHRSGMPAGPTAMATAATCASPASRAARRSRRARDQRADQATRVAVRPASQHAGRGRPAADGPVGPGHGRGGRRPAGHGWPTARATGPGRGPSEGCGAGDGQLAAASPWPPSTTASVIATPAAVSTPRPRRRPSGSSPLPCGRRACSSADPNVVTPVPHDIAQYMRNNPGGFRRARSRTGGSRARCRRRGVAGRGSAQSKSWQCSPAIGRTSMVPYQADGCLDAISIASSRSEQSITS